MSSSLEIQRKEIDIVASVSLSRHDKEPISMGEVDLLVEMLNDKIVEFMDSKCDTYFVVGSTKLSSPRREIEQERPINYENYHK